MSAVPPFVRWTVKMRGWRPSTPTPPSKEACRLSLALGYARPMTSSTPIFACADLEATMAYYRDVLGFRIDWTYGEPANFGSASRGGVTIMFSQHHELAERSAGQSIWVKVDDADILHEEHRAKGAKIVEEIGERPWGVREYVVEDPNGYRLRFAGPPAEEIAKSQPFPAEVVMARKKADPRSFIEVAGAAFGRENFKESVAEPVLSQTWGGVTASLPSGEAVGVLRIMRDAPGWFSVWDVAVRPEWQGRRIGSKMMEEALAMVGEVEPGAFVFLFTFRHGFYERLGFGLQSASFRKV